MRSLSFALLVALTACVQDVGTDSVKAVVQEVPEAPAEAAEPAAPVGISFAVDPAQSSLRALGAKITATHPIDFPEFTADVQVNGADIVGVNFEVKMASLVSDDEKLTGHLKNEDFFDVEKFPTASFKSTTVAVGTAEADFTHTVTGDLSMHGQTKRITIPAKLAVSETGVTANSEFVIDRQDFGIAYPGRPDDLIQDNVRMTIRFVAPTPKS